MPKLGDFRIDFVGKDTVTPAASKARQSTENLSKATGKLKGSVSKMGAAFKNAMPLLTGAAVVAAVYKLGRGFQSLIMDFADAGDRIQKLSIRLGIGTEALSEYQYVADRSGVSFQSLTTAFQRQTRRVAEAAKGTGEAKDALIELGLVATDLKNLAPEEQFEVIAKAITGVTSEADKVRLAMKLWDTEGVALLQTLGDGVEGIQKLRKEAHELGIVFSEEDAKKAAEFKDALTKLKGSVTGLKREIGSLSIPTLKDLAEKLTSATQAVKTHGEEIRLAARFYRMLWNPAYAITEILGQQAESYDKVRRRIKDVSEETDNLRKKTRLYIDVTYDWTKTAKELQDQYWELRNAAGQYFDDIDTHMDESYNRIKEVVKDQKKEIGEVEKAVNSLSDAFATGLAQGVADMIVQGRKFGDVMEAVFRSLIAYAIQLIAKQAILAGLGYVGLGSGAGAVGGTIGGHEGGMVKHTGGMVGSPAWIKAHRGLAPDERPIIAQVGEGILSRRGVSTVGGPGAVMAANQGRPAPTRQEEINIYLVDEREKVPSLGPNDVKLIIASDIQSDGVVRKTIQRFT